MTETTHPQYFAIVDAINKVSELISKHQDELSAEEFNSIIRLLEICTKDTYQ